MRKLSSRPRAEPPLTAPRREPLGRAEPPLTATRQVAPARAAPSNAAAPGSSDLWPLAGERRPSSAPAAMSWKSDAEPDVASAAEGAPFRLRFPVRRRQRPVAVAPGPIAGTLRRAPTPRDPAPSRLSYRLQRLWLTPLYRALFRVGVPAFSLALAAGLYLSDEGRREALRGTGAELVRSVQERPEFMVNLMSIDGASPALADEIRTALPLDLPLSSFDLDLETMRQRVAEIDAVAEVELRIRPGGILEIAVRERVPSALWRSPEGLMQLDAEGHRVARADSRLDRPDLPIIAGEGAEAAVAEALRLIEAAAPVGPRLRGLVRMGERRWDVVLDNEQRILLPEQNAVAALERVMALAGAEDMLARDVSVVDMRNGARPTLRLSPEAVAERRRGQEIETGANG